MDIISSLEISSELTLGCSSNWTDDSSYPAVSDQVLRYISDRTGIISFANFPLIWLFGMRNNVVIWLTGWDFGTYNSFHRWVARVATLQAVIHSLGYSVLIIRRMFPLRKKQLETLLKYNRGRLELFCVVVDAHVLVGW